MVVRRYIDFLILLILTPLVSVLFCSSIPTFCSFLKMFFVLVQVLFYNKNVLTNLSRSSKHTYGRLRASHGRHNEGLHIMFYTRRSTHKRTLHIL